MPNWCNNYLIVKGEVEELQQLKNDLKSEYTNFDFNKIIDYKSFSDTKKDEWKNLPTKEKTYWVKDETKEENGFRQWVFNNGGYIWCVNNWGTKWNTDDNVSVNFNKDKKELTYSFASAWSPPTELILTLIEKYKSLYFDFEYEETGMGFAGEITGEKGEVTSEEEYNIECFECPNCEHTLIKKEYEEETECQDCGEIYTKEELKREEIINELADSLYSEDYETIKTITGKKPNNQVEAERIIEQWKKEN